jgi:hypothetical protein
MKYGMLNVRGPYRKRSLRTAVRELARYRLDLGVYRSLGATKEALQEQGIILFSMEKGTIIINWGQGFSYTRE